MESKKERERERGENESKSESVCMDVCIHEIYYGTKKFHCFWEGKSHDGERGSMSRLSNEPSQMYPCPIRPHRRSEQ
jgi:hypothetical protein